MKTRGSFFDILTAFATAMPIAAGALALPSGVARADVAGVNAACQGAQPVPSGQNYRHNVCAGAQNAEKGSRANKSSAMVWGAVATVCFAACGHVSGMGSCRYARTGGSVADAALSKSFQSLLSSGVTKLFDRSADLKKEAEGAEQTAAAGAKTASGAKAAKSDTLDACSNGVDAAGKAVAKNENHQAEEKQVDTLAAQAKQLDTPDNGAAKVAGGSPATNSAVTAKTVDGVAGLHPSCSNASLQTAAGALTCANTSGESFPMEVTSGQVFRDLQKLTGKSPDAFFKDFGKDPAKAIQSALAATVPAGQQGAFGQLLAATGRLVGGSGGARGDSDVPGMNLDGVMGQMLGALQGGDAPAAAGDAAETFTGARAPAGHASEAAEDRTISIFDRVKGRYGAVSARLRLGGNSQ